MLKIFSEYKWLLIAIAFSVYSIFVWNTSKDIAESAYLKQSLRHAEETIKLKQANIDLAADMSRDYQKALKEFQDNADANKKELADELKATVYSTCRNTDGVRNNYKRKLQAQ